MGRELCVMALGIAADIHHPPNCCNKPKLGCTKVYSRNPSEAISLDTPQHLIDHVFWTERLP